MIKVLKLDDTYRRDQEFVDFSFLDCAKITTQSSSWVWKENMLTRYCLILVSDGCIKFKINKKIIPKRLSKVIHHICYISILWIS